MTVNSRNNWLIVWLCVRLLRFSISINCKCPTKKMSPGIFSEDRGFGDWCVLYAGEDGEEMASSSSSARICNITSTVPSEELGSSNLSDRWIRGGQPDDAVWEGHWILEGVLRWSKCWKALLCEGKHGREPLGGTSRPWRWKEGGGAEENVWRRKRALVLQRWSERAVYLGHPASAMSTLYGLRDE